MNLKVSAQNNNLQRARLITKLYYCLAGEKGNTKHPSISHHCLCALKMCITITGKRDQVNKSKRNSKERKHSTSRRHHNMSKQGHTGSFTNLKNPQDDRIRNIMALIQNSSNTMKMSNYNENIFKAIQSKIMNNKSDMKITYVFPS